MKKIIFKKSNDEITNSSHVGVISIDGAKAYVVNTNTINPIFKFIILYEKGTVCNLTSPYPSNNISELLKISEDSIKEAYVFPTRKDLYKWLSE